MVLALLHAILIPAAHAQETMESVDVGADSTTAGDTTTYTVELQLSDVADPVGVADAAIEVTFPAGFDVVDAEFDRVESSINGVDLSDPAVTFNVDGQVLRIGGLDLAAVLQNVTITLVFDEITNPEQSGPAGSFQVSLLDAADGDDEKWRGTYSDLVIANAALSTFSITGPTLDSISDQVVGEPFVVRIRALDEFGNLVDGTGDGDSFTGTVALTSNVAGSAGLGTTPAFSDGELAGHAVTLTEPSVAAVLIATRTGGSETGSSNAFAVVEGTAAQLHISQQPTTVLVGEPISPAITVEVRDAHGNLLTSDNGRSITVAIETNPGGGVLAGTTTRQTVNGVATFDNLTIDAGGFGYVLRFGAEGLDSVLSSAFDVLVSAEEPILSQATPNEQGFTFTIINYDLDRYSYDFAATNDATVLAGANGHVLVLGLDLGESSTVTVTATARPGSGYVGSADAEVTGTAGVLYLDLDDEEEVEPNSEATESGSPSSSHSSDEDLATTGTDVAITLIGLALMATGTVLLRTAAGPAQPVPVASGPFPTWGARLEPPTTRR